MGVKFYNFHIAMHCDKEAAAQCRKMKNLVSPKNISSNQLFFGNFLFYFHEIFAKNVLE